MLYFKNRLGSCFVKLVLFCQEYEFIKIKFWHIQNYVNPSEDPDMLRQVNNIYLTFIVTCDVHLPAARILTTESASEPGTSRYVLVVKIIFFYLLLILDNCPRRTFSLLAKLRKKHLSRRILAYSKTLHNLLRKFNFEVITLIIVESCRFDPTYL